MYFTAQNKATNKTKENIKTTTTNKQETTTLPENISTTESIIEISDINNKGNCFAKSFIDFLRPKTPRGN